MRYYKAYTENLEGVPVELSAVFQDSECWHLWTMLLGRASYCDRPVKVSTGRGFKTITLLRGQVIYGRKAFAAVLNQSENTVRKNMDLLVQWGNVTKDTTTHPTVVTLCNYPAYNPLKPEDHQASANQAPSEHQASTNHPPHTRRYKKVLEGKETLQLTAIDVSALGDEFNACEGVTKHEGMSPTRTRAFVAKLRDPAWLGLYRRALAKFPLVYKGEDGTWLPDLDWLLRDDNVLKVVEGRLDHEHGKRGKDGTGKNQLHRIRGDEDRS